MSKPAVFVDRDNTLIDDPGYLTDPNGVKLLPGVDLAIKTLRQAGYLVIVVTNQSGIARGLLTEETLEKIHAVLREQLAEKGAVLDAIFYCPFHPDGSVEKFARKSNLRKPGPGMLLQAAEELNVDLSASWMVGDGPQDVGAGQRAKCRTIRIRSQEKHPPAHEDDGGNEEFQADFTVRNLVEAAKIIKRESANDPVEAPAGAVEAIEEPAPETAVVEEPVESQEPTHPPPAGPEENMDTDTPKPEDDNTIRKEILRHVRQLSRQGEHEEFCITNLLGGVSQVLVGLFLILVFYKALGPEEIDQAVLWAIVAVVFQTMSLTFFMMSKQKQ